MSRQPTKREIEKFSPICAQYGRSPKDCRLLISDGRKVGFVLDFGSIPTKHCFQHVAPTLSKKDGLPPGGITLVTHGWKIAVDVRGTLYMGEITFRDSGVPMYRFHILEGAIAVASSSWHDSPTPAFVEIRQKNPDGKALPPDERPNGKLYMAISYSEPQEAMRKHFRENPPAIPVGGEKSYEQWIIDPIAGPPTHLFTSSSLSHPPSSPMVRLGNRDGEQLSSAMRFVDSFSIDPPGNHSYQQFSSQTFDHGYTKPQKNFEPQKLKLEAEQPKKLHRKRTSDNVSMEFDRLGLTSSSSFGSNNDNKKLNRIKEAVQIAHDHLDDRYVIETNVVAPQFRAPLAAPEQVPVNEVVRLLRGDSMDFLDVSNDTGEVSAEEELDEEMRRTEDIFARVDRRLSVNMSAEELFAALKRPNSEMLTRSEMQSAIQTLLRIPIPSVLLEQTFRSCDVERTGKVTLQNFVRAIKRREQELWAEFTSIDTDHSGEITLDELRAARMKGHFTAQERELDALLEAMDRVSAGTNDEHASDRKIQWKEFRVMMILLPPATTIQTIVDLVKQELDERDMLNAYDRAANVRTPGILTTTMDVSYSSTSATTSDVFRPAFASSNPNDVDLFSKLADLPGRGANHSHMVETINGHGEFPLPHQHASLYEKQHHADMDSFINTPDPFPPNRRQNSNNFDFAMSMEFFNVGAQPEATFHSSQSLSGKGKYLLMAASGAASSSSATPTRSNPPSRPGSRQQQQEPFNPPPLEQSFSFSEEFGAGNSMWSYLSDSLPPRN